ncbi:MAG: MBL fold metallo-hydrolase [Isosphaeraceae bacterium]|jgi:glyoxylase-like metal-dependent hydrolase (beta-lactamase superfamily II)|nr:MAG: MBL fold metallo-hydrolase [Isosphaeraceae bacterium]
MTNRGARFEPIVSAGFDQNAYLVWQEGSEGAVVVDPGFDTAEIERRIRAHGVRVELILNTHGHADHIAGNARMKAEYPEAPLVIGRHEAHLLTDPEANLSLGFGLALRSPPADRLVDEGEVLEAAGLRFRVLEIPGHSPGSVVYVVDDLEPAVALVGDVIFAGSVGRCDFPGGDPRRLIAGIRGKLFALPDSTLLLPGHGPATTVGAERRSNPFVGDSASERF